VENSHFFNGFQLFAEQEVADICCVLRPEYDQSGCLGFGVRA